jgi:hypothetical protein
LALQEKLNLFQTGNIHRQAMLGADDSLDKDAADNAKEDLEMELAPLNAASEGSQSELGLCAYHQPIAC